MPRQLLAAMLIAALAAGGCMGVAQQSDEQFAALGRERAAPGRDPAAETRVKPLELADKASRRVAAVQPRKVIHTGIFEILVRSVSEAVAQTKGLAEKMGGYAERIKGSAIVIRVPAAKFDETVAALEKMGTAISKEIAAQDVTDKYTDLAIRIKNAKALLGRLRTLVEKAKTTKDALAIEKEIGRVTLELERLEGRMNSMAGRVAYATLSIAFMPMRSAPPEIKLKLPFWWLGELGLESLLSFGRNKLY